jgi:predicted P-loop ATPase
MKYNGTFNIAVGMGATSKNWKNKEITWSDLIKKLNSPTVTNETFSEYMKASKGERGKIKDVGGYVGAYLREGRRKPQNVVFRQLITLDIDYAHLDFWDLFSMQYSNAAVLHTTHSHSESSPRYRLIMPLDRECSAEEYVAISRKIAGDLDIELFDRTTFQPERLMFWSSISKDSEYIFNQQDGEWLNADEVLDSYLDWKDSSLWATADKQLDDVKNLADKQEDPELKKGMVGAFCRAYSISETISKYLPDVYTEAGKERYTYCKGSTAGGLIVYDDKFAFSHHGTDPCSHKLTNSFDLIRIHKFGHLDEASKARGAKQKSFQAMESLAQDDDLVRELIANERIKNAVYEFSDAYEEETTDENIGWAKALEVDTKGKYLSSSNNLNIIFANDARLKTAFRYNSFDNKRYVFRNLPWRKIEKPETIKNVDYSGIRNYIESVYGIAGHLKIDDSLALEFERNRYNPVKDYLDYLEWDEVPRIETFLTDYYGVDDNAYTREALKKTMVGAVARIYEPGIKFDLVLTLVGEQGTGKSTLAKKLGKSWFSDTFSTVTGKEAFEQLQGAWIIEMAELAGLRKADIEAQKHFITKQTDMFRPAYGRATETYERQCVFIATTNTEDFLNDPTGNRRFMPISINILKATKSVWNLSEEDVDDLWSEAKVLYLSGEKLYLENDAKNISEKEQKKHSKYDERLGIIEQYLDTKFPNDWGALQLMERKEWLIEDLRAAGTVQKNYVCVAEIWCECLGNKKQDMDRYKTRPINDLLKSLDGWEKSTSTKNFGFYGKQKFYKRIENDLL